MRNDLTLNPTLQALREHMVKDVDRQLFEFQDLGRRDQARKDRLGIVSLSRAIQQMATQRGLKDGPELEFFQETAKISGQHFDPVRVLVPWQMLCESNRLMSAVDATSAGFLIGLTVREVSDLLRPWSIMISGGINIESGLQGDQSVPLEAAANTSIYWQATEEIEAAAGSPQFGQVSMTPHTGLGLLQLTRNFQKQADGGDRWLRRALKRIAGMAVDTVALNGSGIGGEPRGALNTPGISTESGTSLAWAGVTTAKENAALANVQEENISFLSTPTVRKLLESRSRFANTDSPIWDSGKIANCAAHATTLMPSATMLCGPMSGITLGLWQNITLEVNPFHSDLFKRGAIQVRVLVSLDTAVTVPASAFTRISSIT